MRMRTLKLNILLAGLLVLAWCVTRSTAADGASPSDSSAPAQPLALSESSDTENPPLTKPERGQPALESVSSEHPVEASASLMSVVDLLRAGTEEEVVIQYIRSSSEPFDVNSDVIIYLTDLGASGRVITEMMEHDEALRSNASAVVERVETQEAWPPAGEVIEAPASTDAVTLTSGPLEATSGGETLPVGEELASVDYFYDYLAPYGTWVDVPEYGLCWQPTVGVSSPGWMPYGDRGRWLYSDHGWYWYSDYSWGWAAFHYGRWFHHTRWGWCWAPGTVWGPSWVSWRYSDPYCGWAPLPPYRRSGFSFSVGFSWGIPSWCYTYVPSYRICSVYPRNYAVHYKYTRKIHHRSKLRNHYAVGRNHRIENRGIPPEDLTRNPREDIKRATLTDRRERPSVRTRGESLDERENRIAVYRPDRPIPQSRSNEASERGDSTRGDRPINDSSRSGRSGPEITGLSSSDADSTAELRNPPERTRRGRPTSRSGDVVAETTPGSKVHTTNPTSSGQVTQRSSITRRERTSTRERTSGEVQTQAPDNSRALVIRGSRTSQSSAVARSTSSRTPTRGRISISQPSRATPSTSVTQPSSRSRISTTRSIQPVRPVVRPNTVPSSTPRTVTRAPQPRTSQTRSTITRSAPRVSPVTTPSRHSVTRPTPVRPPSSTVRSAPSVRRAAPAARSAPRAPVASQRAPTVNRPSSPAATPPRGAGAAPRSAPSSRGGGRGGNTGR